jgi:hypothetical protein
MPLRERNAPSVARLVMTVRLLLFAPTGVALADWRYCYALDQLQQRFYMSARFPTVR